MSVILPRGDLQYYRNNSTWVGTDFELNIGPLLWIQFCYQSNTEESHLKKPYSAAHIYVFTFKYFYVECLYSTGLEQLVGFRKCQTITSVHINIKVLTIA